MSEKPYRRPRRIFVVLWAAGAALLLMLAPTALGDSGGPGDAFVAVIAALSSVVGMLGTIVTTVLAIRADRRAARAEQRAAAAEKKTERGDAA